MALSSTCPLAMNDSQFFTRRNAFDPSGRPGSLYDARRDRIYNHSDNYRSTKLSSVEEVIICDVQTLAVKDLTNLFPYFQINQELQLSVALQMIPATGLGALVNHTLSMDNHTYLLCCHWRSRTEKLSDPVFAPFYSERRSISDKQLTHVINSVDWGVDCAIFLQFPPDEQLIQEFRPVIDKLRASIRDKNAKSTAILDELNVLEKHVQIEVFSNIPDLWNINSISDFYRKISRVKENINLHQPCNYNLYPLEFLHMSNAKPSNIFKALQKDSIQKVHDFIFPLLSEFKRLKALLNQNYPNLRQYSKEYLDQIRSEWSALKEVYTDRIKSLQQLIINIRSGEEDERKINRELQSQTMEDLQKSMKDLFNLAIAMQKKENLIKDLIEKQFLYGHASGYDIKRNDDEPSIERKLLQSTGCDRIICFNDLLCEKNKSQWYTLQGQLIKERDENSQLRVIFVDFQNFDYDLQHMLVLPSSKKKNKAEDRKATTSSSSIRGRSFNSKNILLLGESGAGKSTFINAFANYLIYDTMKEAEKKPMVLIPVSFIMTVGDNFEEQQVKFGGMDTLSNEIHDDSTQSVTQHCKSYVFTLTGDDGVRERLRIIDTPGIGDVRGATQDDINMQHVLSYMNNLTHLDAVCILMKPNSARLNVFFRSCLMQLFDLLGEHARERIIFCFTNSRSTFYTPGNTGPLLKQFLTTLPVSDIPFKKANTFCFDSESFRYLIAKLNRIKFGEDEGKDYENSWEKSSAESKRLLAYVRNDIIDSHKFGERESMKDAQLKINLLVRPILESLRNNLRTIILYDFKLLKSSVKLCPRVIKCTTAICLACTREIVACGDFWITKERLHVFHNKCRTCRCAPDKHYPIDYQLEYEPYDRSINKHEDDLFFIRSDLSRTSAEFAHFLAKATNNSQYDLFMIGFERMIKEEEDICENKTSSQLNEKLLKYLKQEKKKYEEIRKDLLGNKDISLSHIYSKIRDIRNYPEIQSQMIAVEDWRKFMIRYYEHEVRT